MGFILFLIILFVVGFVIGGLARWAVPGPDPMPVWATASLGIGGAIIGGVIARFLIGTGGGVPFALLRAVLLLIPSRKFTQHRPITGPGPRQPPAVSP